MPIDVVIQKGVSRATSRLTIASLYIGTGAGFSHDFVNALSHVANTSAEKTDLRITILLDGARGTRCESVCIIYQRL